MSLLSNSFLEKKKKTFCRKYTSCQKKKIDLFASYFNWIGKGIHEPSSIWSKSEKIFNSCWIDISSSTKILFCYSILILLLQLFCLDSILSLFFFLLLLCLSICQRISIEFFFFLVLFKKNYLSPVLTNPFYNAILFEYFFFSFRDL